MAAPITPAGPNCATLADALLELEPEVEVAEEVVVVLTIEPQMML